LAIGAGLTADDAEAACHAAEALPLETIGIGLSHNDEDLPTEIEIAKACSRRALTWLATPEGTQAVAAIASGVRFAPFGRRRAARRQLWRQIRQTLAAASVQAAIREHARKYESLLASLAFVEALPRTTVDLRRLVIVPRLLLNAAAHELLRHQMASLIDTACMIGGGALRDFLVTTLVDETDRALVTGRQTVGRPVPPGEEWASVGVDLHFTWETPDWSGPAWPGHHYVYEYPRGRLARRQRRRVDAAIKQMAASIARWPPFKRYETLQRAQREAHSPARGGY
jgi:hypothetical protein